MDNKEQWTSSQIEAIESRGICTLISAAAGSGKTAVLVERVAKLICQNNLSADKFLIVTFTASAAAEMKNRINERLSREIEKKPFDSELKHRKNKFSDSFVGTIHSFCAEIIRENFSKAEVSPKFRIAGDEEIQILEKIAVENILENIYKENDAEFLYTIEFFSDEKSDEKFVKTILKIYHETRSYVDPDLFFKNTLSNLKLSFKKTKNCEFVFKFIKENLNFAIRSIKLAANIAETSADAVKSYKPALDSDLFEIKEIIFLINNFKDIKIIYQKFEKFKFRNFKPFKGENEIKEEINFLRKNAKDAFKKSEEALQKILFAESDAGKIFKITEKVFAVVKMFEKEFIKLKSEKNILDFSDLEHLALKILTNGDKTSKSAAAFDIGARFEEIMIDEYQDVNEIQDRIFSLISNNGHNLFMVGDSKQSIYAFRGSNPDLFIKKSGNKINLDKNFRSGSGIINFINLIFKNLMSEETCGINYNSGHELRCGTSYSPQNVDFFLLEKEEDEEFDAESEFAADLISEKINEGFRIYEKDGTLRPAKYGDFCIILRSANKRGGFYGNALTRRGIPADSRYSENFFEIAEAQIMLSLLRIIDNPIQDIPLLSAMMSPVFGFTLDDAAEIRLAAPREIPIYFAVKETARKPTDLGKKCVDFLEKLENFRISASITPLEKFINLLIDETFLATIARARPGGRAENIRHFAVLARKYGGKDIKSLSGFAAFLENLEEKNNIRASIPIQKNAVKIMSVHASKGLEFPICILADCARNFSEEKNEFIINKNLGIGFDLKNSELTVHFKNIYRNILKLVLNEEKIAEELRLLYVALTRAREKLIIIASDSKCDKKIKNSSKIKKFSINDQIDPYFVKNSRSFAQWLMMIKEPEIIYYQKKPQTEISRKTCVSESECKNLFGKIKSRFNFTYPFSDSEPLKTAASSFEKLTNEASELNIEFVAKTTPEFAAMTPAKIGTAIHEFLHFADFEAAARDFKNETERLIAQGKLQKKESESLNEEKIKKFLLGDVGVRIRKSKKVFKEYQFSVNARNIGFNKETIIQGSIDCVFEEPDGFVIIDYKSDKIHDLKYLTQKYNTQLNIYKKSFEICEKLKVKELLIYSFYMNSALRIITV
jgi:ATP-dependent helicase/nuclease subunit A